MYAVCVPITWTSPLKAFTVGSSLPSSQDLYREKDHLSQAFCVYVCMYVRLASLVSYSVAPSFKERIAGARGSSQHKVLI